MSQSAKRDADTAFDENAIDPVHSSKRIRKRKSRSGDDKNTSQQSPETRSPAIPTVIKRETVVSNPSPKINDSIDKNTNLKPGQIQSIAETEIRLPSTKKIAGTKDVPSVVPGEVLEVDSSITGIVELGNRRRHRHRRHEREENSNDKLDVPRTKSATSPPASSKNIFTDSEPQVTESQTPEKKLRIRKRSSKKPEQALSPEHSRSESRLATTSNGVLPPHQAKNDPIERQGPKRKRSKHQKHPEQTNSASSSVAGHSAPVVSTKEEQDQSRQRESTQEKFVQAVQADGLAAFATQPREQLAVSLPTKRARPAQSRYKADRAQANGKAWSFSPAQGGTFIDQDPLLSVDGAYLLLATRSEVQIYATKTSLLVRSLRSNSIITSCAISTADPNKLYVGHQSGFLSIWDWQTGHQHGQYQALEGIIQVLPINHHEKKEKILLLQEGDKNRSIVAYTVDRINNNIRQKATLLKRSSALTEVRSYSTGNVLLVSSRSKLFVGYSQDSVEESQHLSFTWRELTLPNQITSFDAQVNSGKSKTMRRVPSLDIVVGLESGVIMQYDDLLFKLIGKEKNKSNEGIVPRRLHWHRTAVNTVKWSRDRNYLVSGGNETVLVVWQLDTNQRQFLPHLTTSILNLTISAKGSEYVLRLADNSVMILSTADLLPKTNITGLALGTDESRVPPTVLHPQDANRLLAAVPANVLGKGAQQNNKATLLQVYDLGANTQISRQALTRNVATVKNIGPTGQLIAEPNVNYISISHDGHWLATIDEWQRPAVDIAPLYLENDLVRTRGGSTETCLKIWTWNTDDGTWELVTRIDEPHQPGNRSVLGLTANPFKLEFATIGSDATIHIWTPKARHRNGLPVKSKTNEQLYTWSNARTVELNHESRSRDEIPESAALSYAEDSSTLAASWSWPTATTRFVHLIDPKSGRVLISQPELLSNGDAKLVFAGRHLFCLSDVLTSFDILTAQTGMTISLDSEYYGQRNLTRNKSDGTVAISISHAGDETRSSKLLILAVQGREVKPVFESTFPALIQSLLSSAARPGYTLIDEMSRVTTLKPAGIHMQQVARLNTNTEAGHSLKSLDTIFGKVTDDPGHIGTEEPREKLALGEDTEASSSALDTVLKFVSSAQVPSPADLFQRVVGAVVRRNAAEIVAR